jgi:hypothetical protein
MKLLPGFSAPGLDMAPELDLATQHAQATHYISGAHCCSDTLQLAMQRNEVHK